MMWWPDWRLARSAMLCGRMAATTPSVSVKPNDTSSALARVNVTENTVSCGITSISTSASRDAALAHQRKKSQKHAGFQTRDSEEKNTANLRIAATCLGGRHTRLCPLTLTSRSPT